MKRTGTPRLGATSTPSVGSTEGSDGTLLLGIPWERFVGTGMTPDMQVEYDRVRSTRQAW